MTKAENHNSSLVQNDPPYLRIALAVVANIHADNCKEQILH